MKRTLLALMISVSTFVAGPLLAAPWVESIGTPFFAVSVDDVDAAVAWYTKVFGVAIRSESAAEDGSWRIVNLASDRLVIEIIRDPRHETAERPKGFAKVGFGVPDVAVVAGRVKWATGTRPRIVDFRQDGLRILQLRDPDGNIIQLSSPLVEETP